MEYIGPRLTKCMNNGNLTVSDLARWFRRPFPTIVGWRRGRGIGGAPRDRKTVLFLLEWLEEKIAAKSDGFPVPEEMSPGDRIIYLGKIRKTVKRPQKEP